MSHHDLSLNSLSGGGNANNWHASGSGTIHGNNGGPDLNVGGNVWHNQGHTGGGVNGGATFHPGPNTDIGVGGWTQSHGGGSGGQIGISHKF